MTSVVVSHQHVSAYHRRNHSFYHSGITPLAPSNSTQVTYCNARLLWLITPPTCVPCLHISTFCRRKERPFQIPIVQPLSPRRSSFLPHSQTAHYPFPIEPPSERLLREQGQSAKMHVPVVTLLLTALTLITTTSAAVIVECGAVAPMSTCLQSCPGKCVQQSSYVWCKCPWAQGGGGGGSA